MTRKELVLNYLQARKGQWVDGPQLANPEVGGSEGLRRFRELRAEGYPVEERRHPNSKRAVRQYRLIDTTTKVEVNRSSYQPIQEVGAWLDE